MDAWNGSPAQVDARFRLNTGTTYPLLLKGSDVTRLYGFDRHNYAVIDHRGIVRYRSAGSIVRRFDENAIRATITQALEELQQEQAASLPTEEPPEDIPTEPSEEEQPVEEEPESPTEAPTGGEPDPSDTKPPMDQQDPPTETTAQEEPDPSDTLLEDPPITAPPDSTQGNGTATETEPPIGQQDPPANNEMPMDTTEEDIITAAPSSQTPDQFVLHANFPNPFNQATTIRFALGQASPVDLRIYNMIGHLVDQRHIAHLPAGTHTLQWDARGPDGRRLASGVYFYRMETNTAGQTRKMLFLQ